MSQKQLADITGLSTRTVSELASNMTQRYSKDALERICEALDVEVGELLTIEKRKHNEK
ncbi:putative transcriptional regulator [Virgibacillus halotolerans]|nr:putative transcriptional regulator [Virgibacillus halotolerans]